MGSAYYYFAASLPILDFNSFPPLSYEDFLDDCKRLMSPADFDAVKSARYYDTAADTAGTPVVRLWQEFDRELRNELVFARANQAQKDPLEFVRGSRTGRQLIIEAVQRVMKTDDIRETDTIIDRLRWDFLGEFVAGSMFDLTFIVAYSLKLQILRRRQILATDLGKEKYKEFEHQALVAQKKN